MGRREPGGCRETLAVEGVIDLLPCHWGPCLPCLPVVTWAAGGAQATVGIFRTRKMQDFGSRSAVLGSVGANECICLCMSVQLCAHDMRASGFVSLNELLSAPARDLGSVGGGSGETSAQCAAAIGKSSKMFGCMRNRTEEDAEGMSTLHSQGVYIS